RPPQPLPRSLGRSRAPSGGSVPAGIRQHPAGPAVHQEPGPLPRSSDHPELRLRPHACGGHRSGHGAGDRTGIAVGGDGGRRALGERTERMRLFLDTADIEEIREINRWGVLSGVTTNPTLVEREKQDPERVWKEILEEVDGDVSLETTEPEADSMYEQGLRLSQMGPNAVVKVPMTPAGLQAGSRLVKDGVRINVTLVFSPAQA